MFHGGAGNDHPVKIPVPDFIEAFVKSSQVLWSSIFGNMRIHFDQLCFHLQRGIPQKPEQLGLRINLRGHQVHNGDLQRTDILGTCAGIRKRFISVEAIRRMFSILMMMAAW